MFNLPTSRRLWWRAAAAAWAALCLSAPLAQAQNATPDATPDGLVRQISGEVLESVKTDKSLQGGDVAKLQALVDAKIMPYVNFQRLTASAVGRHWRQATPEQQKRLQQEFKTLLLRTYAGALTQVTREHAIAMRPLRAAPEATEVVVRTEVRGRGDPIALEYRLEKIGDVWKIYDVNVLGIWMADQFRSSFAQEINANGIDGLIKAMAQKNAGGK